MLDRAVAVTPQAVVGRSVAEGWDIRLADHKVRGAALVVDRKPVRLELFRVPA